jgi:hypothetical protein
MEDEEAFFKDEEVKQNGASVKNNVGNNRTAVMKAPQI